MVREDALAAGNQNSRVLRLLEDRVIQHEPGDVRRTPPGHCFHRRDQLESIDSILCHPSILSHPNILCHPSLDLQTHQHVEVTFQEWFTVHVGDQPLVYELVEQSYRDALGQAREAVADRARI